MSTYEFMSKYSATISANKDGTFHMFSFPTQHCNGNSIEELIQHGIKCQQNS